MNATQMGRACFKAKWPSTIARRGVQNQAQAPRSRRPSQRPPISRRPSKAEPEGHPNANYKGPTMSPRLMTFLGISVLGISSYCGFLYASYRREVSKSQALDIPTDVSDRYNTTAPTFDAEVELSEKAMRMGSKRADLIRLARGDVLEVSCGTGRNLEYYDLGERRGVDEDGKAAILGCRTLTFVDLSPQMVAIAEEKFEALHPGYKSQSPPVTFRAQDAASVTVTVEAPRGEKAYYDSIVQTMGLCSMPDPVRTLRHLGEITEPKNGRILLLEHGRSHYDWLNRILDNLAPAHADRHGCWWNRDIGAIVQESGLEIVEEKRWHFGTTWRYVLRPRASSE